jgi:hypothetical protein
VTIAPFAAANGVSKDKQTGSKDLFLKVYDQLVEELLEDDKCYSFTKESRAWTKKVKPALFYSTDCSPFFPTNQHTVLEYLPECKPSVPPFGGTAVLCTSGCGARTCASFLLRSQNNASVGMPSDFPRRRLTFACKGTDQRKSALQTIYHEKSG